MLNINFGKYEQKLIFKNNVLLICRADFPGFFCFLR